MNFTKAITLKLLSTVFFTLMGVFIRWYGEVVPLGEVVFFRSAFALLPVVLIFAWRGELGAAVHTTRLFGHVGRGAIGAAGMFFNFAALARLPLADTTAIFFAAPLATVALAALLLGERVRLYRWCAVLVGFAGVLVMLSPYFSLETYARQTPAATIGAISAVLGALCAAGAVVQTRRLTDSETTSSIVFYFSLICAGFGLATLPFGWIWPSPMQLAALIATGIVGGIAQLMMTESFRYAPASVIAPFDYFSMLWAVAFGYVLFAELPTLSVLVGAGVVICAGLYVIWRERQLGIVRRRDGERPPPGPAATA